MIKIKSLQYLFYLYFREMKVPGKTMSYPLKLKFAGSRKLPIYFLSSEIRNKVLMMILKEQGFDTQIE